MKTEGRRVGLAKGLHGDHPKYTRVAAFVVTVLVSVITKSKPAGELKGLVYGLTEMPSQEGVKWYQRLSMIAVAAAVASIPLNFLFWRSSCGILEHRRVGLLRFPG